MLAEQYPEIANFFARHAKNWQSWSQDAAICECLDSIEDKGSYELSGIYTLDGLPHCIDGGETNGS
jgi:hypothetical protein